MPVRLQGLNPDKLYKVEEINLMPSVKSALKANGKIYSGDYLMKVGLMYSERQLRRVTLLN